MNTQLYVYRPQCPLLVAAARKSFSPYSYLIFFILHAVQKSFAPSSCTPLHRTARNRKEPSWGFRSRSNLSTCIYECHRHSPGIHNQLCCLLLSKNCRPDIAALSPLDDAAFNHIILNCPLLDHDRKGFMEDLVDPSILE